MDHLNNRIGYLVMKEDGAVLESGGDLENDERSANIIMELLHLTDSIDDNFMPANSCERINLVYEEHTYSICMSNRRVYVIKLRSNLHAALSSSTATMNGGGGSNLYLDSDNNSSSIALA